MSLGSFSYSALPYPSFSRHPSAHHQTQYRTISPISFVRTLVRSLRTLIYIRPSIPAFLVRSHLLPHLISSYLHTLTHISCPFSPYLQPMRIKGSRSVRDEEANYGSSSSRYRTGYRTGYHEGYRPDTHSYPHPHLILTLTLTLSLSLTPTLTLTLTLNPNPNLNPNHHPHHHHH